MIQNPRLGQPGGEADEQDHVKWRRRRELLPHSAVGNVPAQELEPYPELPGAGGQLAGQGPGGVGGGAAREAPPHEIGTPGGYGLQGTEEVVGEAARGGEDADLPPGPQTRFQLGLYAAREDVEPVVDGAMERILQEDAVQRTVAFFVPVVDGAHHARRVPLFEEEPAQGGEEERRLSPRPPEPLCEQVPEDVAAVERRLLHLAAGASARAQETASLVVRLLPLCRDARPERLDDRGGDLSWREAVHRDEEPGFGGTVAPKRLDALQVHLARLREIFYILMAVHFVAPRPDALEGGPGREVEEDDHVRQPRRAQAETCGQPVEEPGPAQARQPALAPRRDGLAVEEVGEHGFEVFGLRRRGAADAVAGRTEVVRRAPCGREEGVAVADDDAGAVTLAQGRGGVILEHQLRELGHRVETAVVHQPLGRLLEPGGEAGGEGHAVGVEPGSEVVLLGADDAELLPDGPREEAHLSGQNARQGGGDRALPAAVYPEDADVEGHALTPLSARNAYSGPGTKVREPATSRVRWPWKVTGSSSRKNSARSHPSSRISARSAPSMRNRSASRNRRRGARIMRSAHDRRANGARYSDSASSSTRVPGSTGSSPKGKLRAAPARSGRTSFRPQARASTTSAAEGPERPHLADRASRARMSSTLFTRSTPKIPAATARGPRSRRCQRSRFPGTRPYCPKPAMVAAWRTSVSPPALPTSQRITQHGAVQPARRFSMMPRSPASGSRGAPNCRARGFPDPMRRAPTRTRSRPGGRPDALL